MDVGRVLGAAWLLGFAAKRIHVYEYCHYMIDLV